MRFDAFTPGGATLPKRGVLALAAPAPAGDAYVLVATTSAGKFKCAARRRLRLFLWPLPALSQTHTLSLTGVLYTQQSRRSAADGPKSRDPPRPL